MDRMELMLERVTGLLESQRPSTNPASLPSLPLPVTPTLTSPNTTSATAPLITAQPFLPPTTLMSLPPTVSSHIPPAQGSISNNLARLFHSPYPRDRGRRRRGFNGPVPGPWEHTFFCCALVSTDTIPAADEALILQRSGLGRRPIKFTSDGSAQEVKDRLEEACKKCGQEVPIHLLAEHIAQHERPAAQMDRPPE
ncbi:hypothetical protein JOQ06_002331 [Pogonophryne albipinna]|uniref:Uncharacterized protein n=1 Tax=Pogonophryne albipinna TaxID=1090488 RepID=A0AAD6B6T0_9TELE|nr:hypothetical protein JOQ06_002331 [Pogonophryne albipinna]